MDSLVGSVQTIGKVAMIGSSVFGIVVGTALLAGGTVLFLRRKKYVQGTARVTLVHKADAADKSENPKLKCEEVVKTVTSNNSRTKGTWTGGQSTTTTTSSTSTIKTWRCLVDVVFTHEGKEHGAKMFVEGEKQAKAGDEVKVEWEPADPVGTLRQCCVGPFAKYLSLGMAGVGLVFLIGSIVMILLRNNKAAQTFGGVQALF